MDYQKLIEAVKKHGDLSDDELLEASEHGADAGWSGFSYSTDTIRFYDEHEELIWDLLEEQAKDFGIKPLAFIAQFKCADTIVDMNSLKNTLSWFALEEAGRVLLNQKVSG